jgi:ethanolamine ammonia-lyase small subunit
LLEIDMSHLVREPHPSLRNLTSARVALPATGASLATSAVLSFQLAHAQARDAVHAALHLPSFVQRMRDELPVLRQAAIPVLPLQSSAPDRATYLRRPDLGRSLRPEAAAQLQPGSADLAIVVADGLSALAIERNAIPVLAHLLPALLIDGWTLAPLTIVEQGRVAIGDAIATRLGAKCSLVLIGERPGLSTPDSLGAYLTWSPGSDRTDADRNCLSNIHDGGIAPEAAALRLLRYLDGARSLQKTGIALKESAREYNAAKPDRLPPAGSATL